MDFINFYIVIFFLIGLPKVALVVSNLTTNEGDPSSIPGLGGSAGEGKGYSLQYSDLENSMGSQTVGHN